MVLVPCYTLRSDRNKEGVNLVLVNLKTKKGEGGYVTGTKSW